MRTGPNPRGTLARSALIGLMAMSLASCQNMNQEEMGKVGEAIGALGGAILGSQVGSGKGRILAMVAGAAAGYWLGGRLGRHLAEEEKEQLTKATQLSATTGESRSWTNPDTGTTVKTDVVEEEAETQTVDVPVKKSRIKTGDMPPFTLVGKQFKATSGSNVRGGPGTDYVIVGSLLEGETVDVIGKVDGKPWYIIGDNGVGDGFVYSSLLTETAGYSDVVLADPDQQTGPDVELASASTTSKCRRIKQTVILEDGTEETEIVRACEGPDGWEVKDVA